MLLGCGGLGGLICLGGVVVLMFFGKCASDAKAGVEDPEARTKNAISQLGALPDGYTVVASMSFFVLQTTVLTDTAIQADGGYLLGDGHTFAYVRVMANENNKKARAFLSGKDGDPAALAQSGINIDEKDIVKRGQLTIDGRKFSYVASRAVVDGGGGKGVPGINNAILFDCPGDTLHMGVWSQRDPTPDAPNEALELAGTVADEAELARFLKPMNPCGR